MRVRHLLYGIVLGAVLFASQSFAAAKQDATFDSFHPSMNAKSAMTQEVPNYSADWAVSQSQQIAANESTRPSDFVAQKLVAMSTPEACNGGGQIVNVNAFDDQPGLPGEVVNYVIGVRAGVTIATASVKLAPGVLSNYSGLFVQLAPTGGGVLSNYGNVSVGFKHFDGLQRTEHIVLSAAAQFATVKETVGA